jgi:plastocyanin
VGTGAVLFATLLLIPGFARAASSNEAPATVANLPSGSPSASTSAAPIWIVKMNDDDPMYQPPSVQITVGQTIEWQNNGQVGHSVTDDPAKANHPGDALLPPGVKPFYSGNVMPGGRFRHTFTQSGRYRYFCVTHEADKMIGEVIVELPPAPQELAKSHSKSHSAKPRHEVTPSDIGSAAPIQIVRMNDDQPMYQPSSVQISAGQTIEWQNDGQVSHSVTDDPTRADRPGDALLPGGVQPFDSGNVMPGGRFRYTFKQPGRYRYFCHSDESSRMVGEVIVQERPAPRQEQVARSDSSKSTRAIVSSPRGRARSVQVVKMNDEQPMYQPSSVRIVAGQTVEWQNDGQVNYSVTDDQSHASDPVDALRPSGVRAFNSGAILPGRKFRHTFTKPGRYRYFCKTHENDRMVGEVIVAPAADRATSEGTESPDGLSAATRPAVPE